MRILGLIGGMSWESTALYYRHLNEIARDRLGGLHSAKVLLWSFDFAEIAECQSQGDWDGATALMIDAARRLQAGGAEALVICTNTMHKMAEELERASGLPVLHIADATAQAIRRTACARPLLLATRFTMEQAFYRERLRQRHGIDCVIPDEADRALVHRIIYEELCRGVVSPDSKAAYLDVIDRLRRSEGVDGVILGCTEITMLIGAGDVDFPVFDTTRLHAESAMAFAIDGAAAPSRN
ncbi:aspartate/glutamate racemase [Alsobacter soli]|uniref:Aspartate/glutamate racemase n=1 Tax=Alsobacter soli TaxID=2109933 RepID=A0A2T1HMZ4_9HYPH|nr:aspartate/glutamate racemase family protein [Alsobacter soli]PSC03030.1 aspartate/glutamate racemase [Alsobacter soli]